MELRYKEGSLGNLVGKDGKDGKDGFSPKVVVTEIDGGHRLTITDVDGVKTIDVMDGVNGDDGRDGKDGVSDLPTIRHTTIDNVSIFDDPTNPIHLPCCVYLVDSVLGFSFNNDIVYISQSFNELTVTTMDNVTGYFTIEENGDLVYINHERLDVRVSNLEADIDLLKKTGGKPGEPGAPGQDGADGEPGKSAYQIALDEGFAGTKEEWLASLIGPTGKDGKSAYQVAVDDGYEGSVTDWLASLVGARGPKGDDGEPFTIAATYSSIIAMDGDHDNPKVKVGQFVMIDTDDVDDPDNARLYLKKENGFSFIVDLSGATGVRGLTGKSAYQLAVENGFIGTREEWLESLVGPKGAKGDEGKSAYQIAVDDGFAGTETEWLQSLHGPKGADGNIGPAGEDGIPGKSAYEIAQENGFTGTEEAWLASLIGPEGQPGKQGPDGSPGQNGFSPTVTVSDIDGGHRVTITDVNGTETFDVMNGTDTPLATFDDTMVETDDVYGVKTPVQSILTPEQYNTLPEDKKAKGLYIINDGNNQNGSGGLVNGSSGSDEIYSIEEIRIGTWIDGKPLYRKIVTGKVPNTNNAWVSIHPTIENSSVKLLRTMVYDSRGVIRDLPMLSGNGDNIMCAYFSNPISGVSTPGVCIYSTISSWAGSDIIAIIEYIKTTD